MTASRNKHSLDNRANQLNDAHPAYYRARGASPEEAIRLAQEQAERLRVNTQTTDAERPSSSSKTE